MKRILFLLLVLITCFNLAGGYAIAAAKISQANNTGLSLPVKSPDQHTLKKSTVDLRVIQVNKEDSEKDEFVFYDISNIINYQIYSYVPDFKLLNKHFLVHYSTSIKDKERSAYILHQNFRL